MENDMKYSLYWVTERETVCLDCGYKIRGNSKGDNILPITKDKLRCLECYSENVIESERYIQPRISDRLLR